MYENPQGFDRTDEIVALTLCLLDTCSAWVWGMSVKHNPQKVGKDHELHDEDVVQIVKRYDVPVILLTLQDLRSSSLGRSGMDIKTCCFLQFQ